MTITSKINYSGTYSAVTYGPDNAAAGSTYLHGPGGECFLILSCDLDRMAGIIATAIAQRDARADRENNTHTSAHTD